MSAWTKDELTGMAGAEEVRIASLRLDGTLSKPVTIWVVAHGDSLYIRSVNGRTANWFRSTQLKHQGRISAGRASKDVSFEEAGDQINEQVDAAYRAKYRRYAGRILNSVLTPAARSTTTRLVPQQPDSRRD